MRGVEMVQAQNKLTKCPLTSQPAVGCTNICSVWSWCTKAAVKSLNFRFRIDKFDHLRQTTPTLRGYQISTVSRLRFQTSSLVTPTHRHGSDVISRNTCRREYAAKLTCHKTCCQTTWHTLLREGFLWGVSPEIRLFTYMYTIVNRRW